MDVARYLFVGFRILAIVSLLGMAITGKQYGGRKLHMVYRVMIFFIFFSLITAFFIVKYLK